MKSQALTLAWLGLLAIHAVTGNPHINSNPTICRYVNGILFRIDGDQLTPVDPKSSPCEMLIPDASHTGIAGPSNTQPNIAALNAFAKYKADLPTQSPMGNIRDVPTEDEGFMRPEQIEDMKGGQMDPKKGQVGPKKEQMGPKKGQDGPKKGQMDPKKGQMESEPRSKRQTEKQLLRRKRGILSSYEECTTTKEGTEMKRRYDPKGEAYLYRELEGGNWMKKRCGFFTGKDGNQAIGEFEPHSCKCLSLDNPKPKPRPQAQRKQTKIVNSAGCLEMTWRVCCFLCMTMMAIF